MIGQFVSVSQVTPPALFVVVDANPLALYLQEVLVNVCLAGNGPFGSPARFRLAVVDGKGAVLQTLDDQDFSGGNLPVYQLSYKSPYQGDPYKLLAGARLAVVGPTVIPAGMTMYARAQYEQ